MDLRQFRIENMDDSFKDGVVKTLNETMSCFGVKSTLTKGRICTMWSDYNGVLFQHAKYKPSQFLICVQAQINPFDWSSKAAFRFSQVTDVSLDLTQEDREDFIEVCQGLAKTATNMKMTCMLGYTNIFMRHSRLKPKKIMNIEDIIS